MARIFKYSVLLIIFTVLAYSCYDKDLLSIDNEKIFTPEYSVPIGANSFIMEDIVTSSSFDTIPADSAYWCDSIIFQYNDRYYYLPPDAWFDTILNADFDFSQIQDWLDRATYLMFRLNIKNAIPGNMLTQIEFLNANYDPLFSLFNEPGMYIPSGTIEIPKVLQEDVYLTEEEIEMLKSAMHIRTYYRVYIDDISTGIAYYPKQEFFLQMGIRVGLEINMNDSVD